MKKEEMDNITQSIIGKVGEELASQIADDLGLLITDNNKMLEDIEKRDIKIQELNTKNENLISANGNLLQQISVGKENDMYINNNKFMQTTQEEKPKEISYRNLFDERGNFIN